VICVYHTTTYVSQYVFLFPKTSPRSQKITSTRVMRIKCTACIIKKLHKDKHTDIDIQISKQIARDFLTFLDQN